MIPRAQPPEEAGLGDEMNFEMLRLSLLQRRQVDAFQRRADDGAELSRETWLTIVLGETIVFTHRGGEYHYVPAGAEDVVPEPYIVGRIGRQRNVRENEPPERQLRETQRSRWHAALVLIDPTHHGDGQKVAIQVDGAVGAPSALFQALVAEINNRPNEPYMADAEPIIDPRSFWAFAEANRDNITSVEFTFVAPNMFNSADDLDKEMRDMREHERSVRTKLKLENPDGLNVETKRVRSAVDYTARGTGAIKARTKTGHNYNSKKQVRRVKIPDTIETKDSKGSLISTIISYIKPL